MLSQIPIDISKSSPVDIDKAVLRASIIAELDAITLYEQLAAITSDPDIQKLLLDVAKEEKTHVGEFQTLLLKIDPQQQDEIVTGQEEVDKLLNVEQDNPSDIYQSME
jgi:rubrerythrin